jgi:tRNA threonylcarbamoyladenosine biosynthesis protein TsaE
MSTESTWQTKSTEPEATLQAGAQIGQNLRGGELIELRGDLGSGKTTFVRGLAQGMGSKDKVHSPSFTLSNEYKAGQLTLYHFDFYRLNEPGIMQREIAEAIQDTSGVTVVEWAGIIETALLGRRLIITFKPTGETARELNFTYRDNLKYLFPDQA